MTRRAALYGRVSSDEQANTGYSIRGQFEELRPAVEATGRTVVEEIFDPGYSRDNIERPGLDRIYELAAAGEIDEVWTFKWDRYGSSPVPDLIALRLADTGVVMRSLDDAGEGPSAELLNGIRAYIAKEDIRRMVDGSRNGRLQKAREGKLIGNHRPNYGFAYNADRDAYVVDEETMPVVQRIFHNVANGVPRTAVVAKLNEGGIRPLAGEKWGVTGLNNILNSDVYKPHNVDEIRQLVTPSVAATLTDETYGIYWYNRHRIKVVKTTEPDGNGGRRQKRRSIKTDLPESEWVAIPVPDAGIPLEVVEAARSAPQHKKPREQKIADRVWELRQILRCGECGRLMRIHTIRKPNQKVYRYYGCAYPATNGSCSSKKIINAEELEARVAAFVTELLTDADMLIAKIDELIDQETDSLRNPQDEIKALHKRLDQLQRRIEGYWDLAADGDIPKERMRSKVADLEDEKAAVQTEIEKAHNRKEHVEELQRDREAFIAAQYRMAKAGGLAAFAPEERHDIYKRMRLSVSTVYGGPLSVSGEFLPAGLQDKDGGLQVDLLTGDSYVGSFQSDKYSPGLRS